MVSSSLSISETAASPAHAAHGACACRSTRVIPTIIAETRALLERTFRANSVGAIRADGEATCVLSVYSLHLPCLFPQHGAGKKHERRIELEPWQAEVLGREPIAFLRGFFRSDGCCFVNRTGRYRYLSYDFRNRSADVRRLFTDACDLVGIEYRAYCDRVRVYRRESVPRLSEAVGTKACPR
jgi:hypothetical protein